MKCYNLWENVDFQICMRYHIERRLLREIRNNKQEVAKDDSNEYRNGQFYVIQSLCYEFVIS